MKFLKKNQSPWEGPPITELHSPHTAESQPQQRGPAQVDLEVDVELLRLLQEGERAAVLDEGPRGPVQHPVGAAPRPAPREATAPFPPKQINASD